MVNRDIEREIYDLKQRVESLEKLLGQHFGYQPGAHSTNTPHPQLSAISRGAYTVTNGTADRTYDADTVVVAELADVVYTILTDLQTIKILG